MLDSIVARSSDHRDAALDVTYWRPEAQVRCALRQLKLTVLLVFFPNTTSDQTSLVHRKMPSPYGYCCSAPTLLTDSSPSATNLLSRLAMVGARRRAEESIRIRLLCDYSHFPQDASNYLYPHSGHHCSESAHALPFYGMFQDQTYSEIDRKVTCHGRSKFAVRCPQATACRFRAHAAPPAKRIALPPRRRRDLSSIGSPDTSLRTINTQSASLSVVLADKDTSWPAEYRTRLLTMVR